MNAGEELSFWEIIVTHCMWVVVGSKMVGKKGMGERSGKRERKATFLTKLSHVSGTIPGCFPVKETDAVELGLPISVLSYSAAYEFKETNLP